MRKLGPFFRSWRAELVTLAVCAVGIALAGCADSVASPTPSPMPSASPALPAALIDEADQSRDKGVVFPFDGDTDFHDRILRIAAASVYANSKFAHRYRLRRFKAQGRVVDPNEFIVLRETLRAALLGMVGPRLADASAYALAQKVERAAVQAKGLRWNVDYGPHAPGYLGADENPAALVDAVRSINSVFSPIKKFDVPYVAGYDVAGRNIYIDRHVANAVFGAASSDQFLVIHEVTEKSLLLLNIRLKYQEAHQCALRAERAAAEAMGARWEDYDRLMQGYINTVYQLPVNVPPSLDLTPYRDEQDTPYVQRMEQLMRSGTLRGS